jgi:aspartyl-tRNA(Asn)/glutamyl-tRNA(Gln) amidotransferase subunit A
MVSERDVAAKLAAIGLEADGDEIAGVSADMVRLAATLADASDVHGKLPANAAFADHFERGLADPHDAAPLEAAAQTASVWREAFPVAGCTATARALQQQTNAFIEIFDAPDLSKSDVLSPLAGLPFAYKDALATPERSPTVGVGKGYRWSGPPSTTLARLRGLGAVAIGATNLDPHSYMPVGLNRDFGRALNPHGSRFAVGGSSSGSAVAVAAGIVPFAVGADTGGSVRIPAAMCGVFGLKPSYGAIVDPGLAPLSPSHDGIGFLAADVALLATVFAAFRPEPKDDPQGERPLVIGIDPAITRDSVSADVGNNLTALLARARDTGFAFADARLPSFAHFNALASTITSFEAIAIHREAMAATPEFYPGAVRRRLLSAACVSEEQYTLGQALRPRLLDHVLSTVFDHCDIIICPTIGVSAHEVADLAEDDVSRAGGIALEYLRLNRPFSYLGLPSLSIPFGKDKNGIPTGFQFVGRPHSEFLLMRAAARLILVQDRARSQG